MKIDVIRLGLLVGGLVAAMHVMWAMLVAMRWAQPLLDFIFRVHFLSPPFQVEAFDTATASILIGVTGGVGFVVGIVFALAWNALHSAKKPT